MNKKLANLHFTSQRRRELVRTLAHLSNNPRNNNLPLLVSALVVNLKKRSTQPLQLVVKKVVEMCSLRVITIKLAWGV
jgi:hypothetical protein